MIGKNKEEPPVQYDNGISNSLQGGRMGNALVIVSLNSDRYLQEAYMYVLVTEQLDY